MHDHPPTDPDSPIEDAEHENSHEQQPRPTPRIYVASLADYNNGRLHGQWLDAARDPADIHADITAMLASSKEPDAEEFAIHDYDQFGSCRIDEYDSIERVALIANGIQEHGYAFAAWAEIQEGSTERFDDFEAAYLGHYDSVVSYAEQILEDLGYQSEIDELPESVQQYIHLDAEAMARDIASSGEVRIAQDPNGGVWVFNGDL